MSFIYFRIISIYPAALELFKFSHISVEELPENDIFCSHALQVGEAISMTVSSMDDLDGLSLVLKDLGAAHGGKGLKSLHFDVSTGERGLNVG